MRLARRFTVATIACGVALAFTAEARAVSPRNPYRTFNLSGVNYGSMRWEQAQRQGQRVWPYYGTSAWSSSRSGNVVVGGFGGGGTGAVIQGVASQSGGRLFRRR
jgi:hypothetical protein